MGPSRELILGLPVDSNGKLPLRLRRTTLKPHLSLPKVHTPTRRSPRRAMRWGNRPMYKPSTVPAHQFDDAEQQHEASSIGMWIFLATEVMFFGGMFTGYAMYRTAYPQAFAAASSDLDIWLGTINTAVFFGGSIPQAFAVPGGPVNGRKPQVIFL